MLCPRVLSPPTLYSLAPFICPFNALFYMKEHWQESVGGPRRESASERGGMTVQVFRGSAASSAVKSDEVAMPPRLVAGVPCINQRSASKQAGGRVGVAG